jgi:hypothetical protein
MNAYSIVHNYGEPTYSPDFNLISTALNFKQQKLDVNRQKLQSIYDQFSSLDVYREDHKEYVNSRLKQVLDINKSYHNMDLSDSNFASVVAGNVMQVADDVVKGAIADTRIIRKEDAEWEKHRVAADGKYNERNHQYALEMSDRRAYRGAEELGRRYKGGADFIAYTDYNKKYNDNIDKVLARLKVEQIETGPNVGAFRNIITREIVTADKIREEMSRVFDENDKRQMKIDGWAQYSRLPEGQFQQMWNDGVNSKTEQLQEAVETMQARIARGGLTKDEKQQAESIITTFQDNIQSIKESRFENLVEKGFQPVDLYGQLYTSNYIDSIANTNARNIVKSIDLDKAHAESVKFNQANKQFEMNYALKEKQLELSGLKEGFKYDPKLGWIPIEVAQGAETTTQLEASPNKDLTEENVLENIVNQRQEGFKKVNDIIKSNWGKAGNLSSNQRAEVIGQITNNTASQNQDGTFTIKVSGNNVVVTEDEYKQLVQASYNATNENPVVATLHNNYKSIIEDTYKDMGKLLGGNNKYAANQIPEIGFTIKDVNGKLTVVKTQGSQAKREYLTLLGKQQENIPLSAPEELMLKAYTAAGLAFDKGVGTKEDRQVFEDVLMTDILAGVNGKNVLTTLAKQEKENVLGTSTVQVRRVKTLDEINSIGDFFGEFSSGWGDVVQYRGFSTLGRTETKYDRDIGLEAEEAAIRAYKAAGNEEIGFNRRGIEGKNIVEQSLGNYGTVLNNKLTTARTPATQAFEKQLKERNIGVAVHPSNPNHKQLQQLWAAFGQYDADIAKKTIKIVEQEDGSDKMVVGVYNKPRAVRGNPVIALMGESPNAVTEYFVINRKELEARGIIAPKTTGEYNPRLDAANRDNAATVSLGTTDQITQTVFFNDYKDNIEQRISFLPQQAQAEVRTVFNDFIAGNLKVEAAPSKFKDTPDTYLYQLTNSQGQVVETLPLYVKKELYAGDIVQMQRQSLDIAVELFETYLQRKLNLNAQ